MLRNLEEEEPPGSARSESYEADVNLQGDERFSVAGLNVQTHFAPGSLACRTGVRDHRSRVRPGRVVRRRRHLPRFGRADRLRRRLVRRRSRTRSYGCTRHARATRRCCPVTPARPRWRRSCRRTRSSTASARGSRHERDVPVAARHAGLAAGADGDPARGDRAGGGDLRRRRLPRDGGAADRGHRPVRPHQRRGLRRGHEGDVLVRRPRRSRHLAAARS